MSNRIIYIHNCVYRITNKSTGIHYIGSHSSNKYEPHLDIGVHYFGSASSSEGRTFRDEWKINPTNFKVKIVKILTNIQKKDIIAYEARYQRRVKAKTSSKFINKAYADAQGTCCMEGMVAVKISASGEKHKAVYKDDPRLKTGELCGVTKGSTVAKDPITNESLGHINLDDPRWKTGEIISINAGYYNYVDSQTGESIRTTTDDPRIKTKEIFVKPTNSANAKNVSTGEFIGCISLEDPRWKTGEIVGQHRNSSNAKDPITNESLGRVSLDDPRWKTGEIVGVNKNKKLFHSKKRSKEAREKYSLAHKIYLYHSPFGTVDNPNDLSHKIAPGTLRRYCSNSNKTISKESWRSGDFFKNIKWEDLSGKTYGDFGFKKELKRITK